MLFMITFNNIYLVQRDLNIVNQFIIQVFRLAYSMNYLSEIVE